MKIHLKQENRNQLLFYGDDSEISKKVTADWFEADYWQRNDAVVGQSNGRQIAWFISPSRNLDTSDWVLRHYYRGGAVAKLTQDRFFFSGLANTRCWREMTLLNNMNQAELPVPKAIAARVVRKGLFYTADLIMQKLNASDLVAHLTQSKIDPLVCKNIGSVIRKFHDNGIFHADLNAHNIMLDDAQKVWLIDFDRCEQRPIVSNWQQQNLQRLHRSFIKERSINDNFYFRDEDWDLILQGYRNC